MTRMLNFDDEIDPQRAIELQICADAPPGGSRPTAGANAGRLVTGTNAGRPVAGTNAGCPVAGTNAGRPVAGATAQGAPPPPRRSPPPAQPRFLMMPQEFDAQGLPLYSTPMDNIIVTQAAVANLNPNDDTPGAMQIRYAQALLAKAVE